jgi:hypothetical protein
MGEAAKLLNKGEAETRIRELAKLRADGEPSKLKEALEIARAWGIREETVEELFDNAERLAAEVWVESETEAEAFFKNSRAQPEVELTQKQPADEADDGGVEFDESDFAPEVEPPPTIEQKQEMLEELAELWAKDPIAYARKKKEVANRLAVNQVYVDSAVKQIRDRSPRKMESSPKQRG